MSNQSSYATDEECQELREQLIASGRIKPISEQPESDVRSKDVFLPKKRIVKRTNASQIPEEGSYEPRPIQTQEECERRRMAYLYMLQSLLRTRIEMGLDTDDRPQQRAKKRKQK